MATIKSYTDLEQSKKLAKILPIESADMEYLSIKETGKLVGDVPFVKDNSEVEDSAYSHTYDRIACWSLAALLRLMPNFNMFKRTIECKIETTNHLIDKACDPIDAAFEMVCWLKEKNEL